MISFTPYLVPLLIVFKFVDSVRSCHVRKFSPAFRARPQCGDLIKRRRANVTRARGRDWERSEEGRQSWTQSEPRSRSWQCLLSSCSVVLSLFVFFDNTQLASTTELTLMMPVLKLQVEDVARVKDFALAIQDSKPVYEKLTTEILLVDRLLRSSSEFAGALQSSAEKSRSQQDFSFFKELRDGASLTLKQVHLACRDIRRLAIQLVAKLDVHLTKRDSPKPGEILLFDAVRHLNKHFSITDANISS